MAPCNPLFAVIWTYFLHHLAEILYLFLHPEALALSTNSLTVLFSVPESARTAAILASFLRLSLGRSKAPLLQKSCALLVRPELSLMIVIMLLCELSLASWVPLPGFLSLLGPNFLSVLNFCFGRWLGLVWVIWRLSVVMEVPNPRLR
jgi:hypothetical protein